MPRQEAAHARSGWLLGRASPISVSRSARQGSPRPPVPSISRLARGSLLQVSRMQRQTRDQEDGVPSGSVATRTREAYGCPVSRSSVASDALERRAHEAARGRAGSAAPGVAGRTGASSTGIGKSTVDVVGCWDRSGHNRPEPNRLATIYARRSHKAACFAGTVEGCQDHEREKHDRSRRRRAQHPHLARHGAGGRGLQGAHLQRRRRRARGADRGAGRPRHPRHQDAAHGRHGAAAPPAPADRHAGDLPHLQGRGDRRAVRPQDGRRRLHRQAVLAAPGGRARQGGAAALPAQGRRQRGRRGRARAGARQAAGSIPSATPATGTTTP